MVYRLTLIKEHRVYLDAVAGHELLGQFGVGGRREVEHHPQAGGVFFLGGGGGMWEEFFSSIGKIMGHIDLTRYTRGGLTL